MTKFKWHLLLTPEVRTEQSQGIIPCESCSIWQVTTLTSRGLSSLCVSWTTFGATPRCHLVFIGFFRSANTVLILKELKWLLISLQCRGCPSDLVDAQSSLWPWPQMLCLRGELFFTSLQQQHCPAVPTKVLSGSFFTGSLGSYTISSDCSQNYWWKAGIPLGFSGGEPSGTAYAVLRLPRNGPVGVGCCPSMASALALRLFFSPAVWVKIWVYYGHLPIFQSYLAAEKTLAAVEVIQPGMWAQCKPDCLCGMNLWLWKLAVAISIFLAFNLKNTQWQIIAVNIQS